MQTGGLILIVIGILIVYGAVTGKLDCFLTALNTCYSSGELRADAVGEYGVPKTQSLPSVNPSNILKDVLAGVSVDQQRAGMIFS